MEYEQGWMQDFSNGGDFCKGGQLIDWLIDHCLINKMCELGACFTNSFLCVNLTWGVTSHPFHPLDLSLHENEVEQLLVSLSTFCWYYGIWLWGEKRERNKN